MIEIPLTKGYIAIVDDEDADLAQYRWYAKIADISGSIYAESTIALEGYRDKTSMHRIILGRMLGRPLTSNELCDHIHGRTLDNRRSELRLVTATQNRQNRAKGKNNTTGFKGVSKTKAGNKFRAAIMVNKRAMRLGTFDTAEEAYAAYCEAAKKYHGEFARLD